MNQKETRAKWGGLSTRHDLKPNITTERAFRRRSLPGPSERVVEGRERHRRDEPVSRADMSATVYYRGRRYGRRGLEEH